MGVGIAWRREATLPIHERRFFASDLDAGGRHGGSGRAAELIRRHGRRAITIEADVSNVEQVKAMVAKTQEGLGRLDILVNGAGINIRRPADTFTEADYDHLMDVNLKSAFFTSIEAGRVMRSQKRPGAMALTVTPSLAHSSASCLVSCFMPPLLIA